MKVLIVFDSVFGNTEEIARAAGTALEPRAEVAVFIVGRGVTPSAPSPPCWRGKARSRPLPLRVSW